MGDTEPMDMLSSKGRIKRSEFIRIITDALISLPFKDTEAHLEQNSSILLQTPPVKLFLEQLKTGKWDESIASLQGFQLDDEKGRKALKFLILEQKYFDFLKIEKFVDALDTLRLEIVPHYGVRKPVGELICKAMTASGEDTEMANSRVEVMGDTEPMEMLGSKGLIKRSEFIRIITDALISLGFDDTGAHLEHKSGIPLQAPLVKLFLEQVKNGEWDKSIASLQEFQLDDEKGQKALKFLLLEQKYFDFLKIKKCNDAVDFLRLQIVPPYGLTKRVRELICKAMTASGEDTEMDSRSKVLEKVKKLLPFAVPERRLEYLLEETLHRQLNSCAFHNHPDPIESLSLFSDHHCSDPKIPSVTVQILEEHTDEVWFLKFSHNGKYLASSSKDKTALIWEINAEGIVLKHKLEGHEKPVVAVLWSPDDQQVITCGENENIRLWDVDTGLFVRSYEKDGVRSVSCGWFHDGSGIIGGMADRSICLWSLDGTELEHEQRQRTQRLSDVAMTSDGKWLVSVGNKCEISLFDRETRAETLIPEEDMITSFALSKDSKHLLINLITQKICLWNIEGQPSKVSEFVGHRRSRFIIRSCFGGYKESFIASGSEDSQVRIWHWSRNEWKGLCQVLQGHAGAVNCVSWNPTEMHMLASASDDGTIRIWGLDKKLK